MNILRTPQEYKNREESLKNECKCPVCQNDSWMNYGILRTETSCFLFNMKLHHYMEYTCSECGAQWEYQQD